MLHCQRAQQMPGWKWKGCAWRNLVLHPCLDFGTCLRYSNIKYIYYQLSFVALSTLVAAFDHSVSSVTLATALDNSIRNFVTVCLPLRQRVDQAFRIAVFMHLTKKSCAYLHIILANRTYPLEICFS